MTTTSSELRRSSGASDSGLTLIELLIVLIVIAMLAMVAVPTFIKQRRAARDTAVVAAVTNLGQEVAATFVDGDGPTGLTLTSVGDRRIEIHTADGDITVPLSKGAAFPTSGAWSNLSDETAWCVSLTDPSGATKTYRYLAEAGVERGSC